MKFKTGDKIKFKRYEEIKSINKDRHSYFGISKKRYKEELENNTDVIKGKSASGNFIFENTCFVVDSFCLKNYNKINLPNEIFEMD